MKLKSDIIYNRPDNVRLIKSKDNRLYIVCKTEEQVNSLHERFYNTGNILVDYKEEDGEYIIVYEVTDDELVFN